MHHRTLGNPVRGLAVTVAALALAGCSALSEPDRPAPSPDAEAAPGSATVKISRELRKEYFAHTSHALDFVRWPESGVHSDGSNGEVMSITNRRLPGCAGGFRGKVAVDQDVDDFAWNLEHRRDGYDVARQLTIYPTEAAARAFTKQFHANVHCPMGRRGGRSIVSVETSRFTADRFFGVTDIHDGTRYSQGTIGTRQQVLVYIDAVTRKGNVVALTRVVDPDHQGDRKGLHEVMAEKDSYPGFVKVVRDEATESAAVLDSFE